MTEVGVGVRGRQGGTSDPNGATTARGTSTSGGGGGDAVQSSTLATSIAAKSAFYDEAFARSISLAHGKNAAALAASANKSGPRSHARAAGVGVGLGAGNALGGRGRNGGHAMLEAVDESDSALDLDSYAYADTDGRVVMAGTPLLEGQEQEQQGPDGMTHGHVAADGGVRDLLTHIYGGRGTIPGRW